MKALVRKHHGNLSAIAEELGNISRQGLTRRLERLNLATEAATQRTRHGVTGQRRDIPDGDRLAAAERERYLKAIAKHSTNAAAYQALGVCERQFYRKLQIHGITPREIEQRRASRT